MTNIKNFLLSRLVISAALISSPLSITAKAELVSKVSDQFEQSEQYLGMNAAMGKALDLPFYFNVPFDAFSEIDGRLETSRTAKSPNAPVMVTYRHSDKNSAQAQLGLRLIIVNNSVDRKELSKELANSGVFEPGDVILTFRKEWYRTLRYSHIQLGVSHAGLLYLEGKGKNKFLKNLDMPLDEKHVGQGYLNSEHYKSSMMFHVLRPKLSKSQKANVNKWIQKLASVGGKAYADSKIRFNQDYSAPKFRHGQPLKFVADVGRIALGMSNDQMLTQYCSEFVWSILSLADCNPDDRSVKREFQANSVPSCVSQVFDPMPLLGDGLTDGFQNGNIGMIDGVPLIAQTSGYAEAGMSNQQIDQLIGLEVFAAANGNATKISQGHRDVEKAVLAQNPKFYDMLAGYYTLVNDEGAGSNPQVLGLRQGFNASQLPNYSPTSFIVHGLLPNGASVKTMDYVGTIGFISSDIYSKVRGIEVAN